MTLSPKRKGGNFCGDQSLYKWSAYTADPETLRNGFAHSLLTYTAYQGDKLVGIIRAVGDGHTIVFIQDILVHPNYQRKGIGAALMRSVLESYPHVRQIELATDNTPETIAFYEAMGFHKFSEIGCCGFMYQGS